MIEFDRSKGYWVYGVLNGHSLGLLEHIQKGQTVTCYDYSEYELIDCKPHTQWNTWGYNEYIIHVERKSNNDNN
jgi:hypothetical protein